MPDLLFILKQQQHLVMPQPEIQLKKIRYGLGPSHQLTIPGPLGVHFKKYLKRSRIEQIKQRRASVLKKPLKPSLHKFFIGGVKGFGIWTFLPEQEY